MAVNKESTGYVVMFSVIMVVVVGLILSSLSMSLKPMQKANEMDKKRMDIMGAIQVESTRKNAQDVYGQYIKEEVVLNNQGEKVEGDAFKIDIKKQFRDKSKPDAERRYPLFVCEKEGKTFYVVPTVGKGLWGPIWGYVALGEDLKSIYGAKFDHKTETPGLGAEIKEAEFQNQYEGKMILDAQGMLTPIEIVKGGAGDDPHKVDAITGGTITSDGVGEMMERTFGIYELYFKTIRK